MEIIIGLVLAAAALVAIRHIKKSKNAQISEAVAVPYKVETSAVVEVAPEVVQAAPKVVAAAPKAKKPRQVKPKVVAAAPIQVKTKAAPKPKAPAVKAVPAIKAKAKK